MGDSYTVQISSKLIDRLVYDETQTKKKTKKVKPIKQKKPVDEATSKDKTPSKSDVGGGWPLQPPIYFPVSPPTQTQTVNPELEAIKSVLQQSEMVLDRLQKHEDQMVEELTQRAKELRDKEFKLPYQKPIPCIDERTACQKCYEEYLKDPLKCANLVKRFQDCARQARRLSSLAT